MPKVSFYGTSDDLFETDCPERKNLEYELCNDANGKPMTYLMRSESSGEELFILHTCWNVTIPRRKQCLSLCLSTC
jgi:hypothetical protein